MIKKHDLAFILTAVVLLAMLLYLGGCRQQAPPEFLEQRQPIFTALFFSDTQADPASGDYSAWGDLLSRAVDMEQPPALVIFGGDSINDGGNEAEWRDFWQAAASSLDGLITAAVAGNHDSHALLAEQFTYPRQAPASHNEGFFYSLDMSPVHFIMLDSNIMGAAKQKDIEWLRDVLNSNAANEAVWRVAVMHHPMWPPAENPKDTLRAETMQEFFLPLLESYGVDLILAGHQHIYARSLPRRGEEAAEGGIIQIMAASGSKESYAATNLEHIAVSAVAPNYLLLTADNEALTVTAYDEHNEVFDICMLMKEQYAENN
ncbi:MAG: metallophosphoesterase [Clostridiales bacterium]|nr:metallophosphoesterase [Clostridiales bacterium]